MTSPFDPHMIPPGEGERSPLGGDIIGGRWAVAMGVDRSPRLEDSEPCPICGTPLTACTHDGRNALMPGTARKATAKRVGPGRPRKPGPEQAGPGIGTTHTIASEPGEASVIADTQEGASFTVTTPGQTDPAAPVATEVTRTDQVDDPTAPRTAAASANAEDPGTDKPRAQDRPARQPGEPDGYILNPGDKATRIPVRRVDQSMDLVEARENVYVRRQAVNANETIYTLLVARGTQFPKAQLDTVVQ